MLLPSMSDPMVRTHPVKPPLLKECLPNYSIGYSTYLPTFQANSRPSLVQLIWIGSNDDSLAKRHPTSLQP